MRCTSTRRRSRTATILRKKASMGTIFSCVPALPGFMTSWTPVQRSPISPDTDCSAFSTARTACTILRTSSSSSATAFLNPRSARQLAHPRARRVHQAGHVPVRVAVLVHELVHVRDLLEGEGLGEAGVDPARRDQIVQGLRLLVVGEVGALGPFLPPPEVAEGGDRAVAARAGPDDRHAC